MMEISTINEFKTNIINFVSNLKKYVEERIKRRESLDKINSLKIQIKEFKEIKNYYISLNIDVETIENNPKDRYTEINDIYTKLYNEYKSNSNFYTGVQKFIAEYTREETSIKDEYVYEIFKAIIEKINPVDEINF